MKFNGGAAIAQLFIELQRVASRLSIEPDYHPGLQMFYRQSESRLRFLIRNKEVALRCSMTVPYAQVIGPIDYLSWRIFKRLFYKVWDFYNNSERLCERAVRLPEIKELEETTGHGQYRMLLLFLATVNIPLSDGVMDYGEFYSHLFIKRSIRAQLWNRVMFRAPELLWRNTFVRHEAIRPLLDDLSHMITHPEVQRDTVWFTSDSLMFMGNTKNGPMIIRFPVEDVELHLTNR